MPISVSQGLFYSSNVAKNEYTMLTKSLRTGPSAEKSASENKVISVYTNSSTFIVQ